MRSGSGRCGPAGLETTASTEPPDSRALAVMVDPAGADLTAVAIRLLRILGGRRGLELELARIGARPHDDQLLVEVRAQVDGGDVNGDRPGLDAGEVEQLL